MPEKMTMLSKNVIHTSVIQELGKRIHDVYSAFDLYAFIQKATENLDSKGLSERLQAVTNALSETLPKNQTRAFQILIKSLPSPQKKKNLDGIDLGGIRGFIMISVSNYVATYGLDHLKLSLSTLKEMTKVFSAENAIRSFLKHDPDRTLEVLKNWLSDLNPHVRRLVSEGTRPRLPLCVALSKFKKDPSPLLPFLEILKDDSELYVRRSVANNLNDISKDHPNIVVEALQKWQFKNQKNGEWLTKHALRTLEKKGHPGAMKLLGYNPIFKVKNFVFSLKSKEIHFGDSLDLSLSFVALQSGNVVIDFIIHFMKANGKTSPKVFKWSKKTLQCGEKISLSKKHSIKKITTRKYCLQSIQVQVNGKSYTQVESFNLII